MWQRIQSVLMVLSLLSTAVFLGTNSYVKMSGPTDKVAINAFQIYSDQNGLVQKEPVFYLAVLAGLSMILMIYTLFQYKNRMKQMLLLAFNSLLLAAAMGTTFYHITKTLPKFNGEGGEYSIGIFAIFMALIANWMANRFIKKDEKLVKDADSRLR